MNSCYCDAILPTFCRTIKVKHTRRRHRCTECHAVIPKGSSCEYVTGLWDGVFSYLYTCELCLEMRDWAKISFPCLCLVYGELLEEVYDKVCEAAPLVPGLFFEYGRRRVRIRRVRRAGATV